MKVCWKAVTDPARCSLTRKKKRSFARNSGLTKQGSDPIANLENIENEVSLTPELFFLKCGIAHQKNVIYLEELKWSL